ncbi:MAG: family 2 glycosyltransferase SpsQ [Candidatus Daviesbacteria bacterium GW2011_GWA1_41_61]|uniref:Family 2 glycosyltransferase SpsQ n=1 Tax=Candidatus Daviesbacteria bacterium GW2011_GWA2_40_9 TaxID=1618424 RepID=A0A0G0TZL9_9BACT|nr:MAG: family 2 glycosyltransferase SpsQ [Candidatus Daviesbacteria bacterium GW2011_GWC1_40_9]KKR82344.1 MAG: family 2 glycosyltransferase SpsQ [Candidatus Daviesbacteria bacterium GW2011_GWA2_40_9]KKR92997.1 MAG: family 2 glycosyltransferase SpsQ [Candidatus Daviesbacteria bacterium GW2011_GWB1_41_15]KKS15541.1 MAG: family 2 glycosyltransferase SpsQ [Candidatus Daviesbacteria bacterium GW2011_GWA1_41_61]
MKTSVIIPAFNATLTIGKCLLALSNQSLKPGEVIIVDDGSKDNLKSYLNQIKPQLKINNLIFLKHFHQGVSVARNLGAKKARGEILAFLDSDCVPGEDWLKNLLAPFSDIKVGAVGGGYSAGIDDSFWQRFSCEELFFRRRKRKGEAVTLLSNNMACRKFCFWKAGGFPTRYSVCEDMFLGYQIARHYKVMWLKDNGVKHHFKRSLKDFLRHQYYFGKQSTRFFLENPQILVCNNHQGKQLHIAIGASFFSLVGLMVAFILSIVNQLFLSQIVLILVAGLLAVHFFLYSAFLSYLKKKGLSKLNLFRAYYASYLRDLLAAVSFFDGLALYIKERKL